MKIKNIFSDIPKDLSKEIFEQIIAVDKIKIERIISKGHSAPDNKWYNQKRSEFVIILKGNAELLFEKNNKIIKMKKGDYINILKHVKHRVIKTNPEKETIWLAVFY